MANLFKKPSGRKKGKYFKGKAEDSNRSMKGTGVPVSAMGKRFKTT